jgi:hypothetical protein
MQKNKSSNHHKQDTKIFTWKTLRCEGKNHGTLKLPLSTIMGLQIVFFRTISRGYHHIKNTHILGLKHKFITSKVDSNQQQRKVSPSGDEQPSNWRGSPTIDTSQCVALVVRNNILKFHQDRTIDDPPISDGNNYVRSSIFLLRSLFSREAFFQKTLFPLLYNSS